MKELSTLYIGISAISVLLWLKEGGVRDLEEYYYHDYGLSANISHQVVLYWDNIVLLRYNKWKASGNTCQLDNWIKLIHV